MKKKRWSFVFLILTFLLQAECIPAQEYPGLWRNSKTDDFYLIQKKINEYYTSREKDLDTGYEDGGHKQFKRWEYFMKPRVYPSGKLINPAKLAMDEALRYEARSSLPSQVHNGNWQSLGINYYFRSTGAAWTGGMGRVNCVTPHPTDMQTLFAGTPSGGIWKTTDAGKSWAPLSDGIPTIGVSGIAINPHSPDSIYILTGDGDGGTTYSTGVLLSANGGDTWQSTGLQWDASVTVSGYKLLMHPANSNMLFAVTDAGIYKTTDGGGTGV